ncbi:inorganic pyrophosphatase [Natranaerovirga hydrolytica]|uniref:inorganic diphosphatase n=1 Tax=Natranaerovirga hydrolytica TaxID=680378 RepID=A0A4R1MQ78_9FIRM|nr:NUDIX domain-containing protein [Natranaerovirga hydrolytica]TCK92679.1 inorganic pyrophosphatase [Natranaerovirga hydrolytica]
MIEYLGREVEVKIDRPLGSKHPDHGFVYPINYGFIEGTKAADNEEIDAYVLGIFEPISTYRGKVIGIIKRNNDVEDKLIVANDLNSYDKYQIKALTEFQERFFDTEIITYDYLRSSIRNTVRGLIKKGNKILVLEEKYQGEKYYFLPGGGIEYLEKSQEALYREMKEELNVDIVESQLMHVIDNIFEANGIKAHEATQIYEVKVSGIEELKDGDRMDKDLMPSKIRWIDIEELRKEIAPLYPEELKGLLSRD